MFKDSFLSIIIIINIELSLSSIHAVIGNYCRLNPTDCGISNFTPDLDENVFKLPDDNRPYMSHAMNFTSNESPWAVKIVYEHDFIVKPGISTTFQRSFCTGSLIANQWILIAAHCLGMKLEKRDSIRIYIGVNTSMHNSSLEGTEMYLHPQYLNLVKNDIGLIKLKDPVTTNDTIRSICLPKSGIFNKRREWSIIAGWGAHNNTGNKNLLLPLQYGYFRFFPLDDYSSARNQYLLIAQHSPSGPFGCQGDSGGPAWQFDNKRAVIIGIANSFTMKNPNDKCGQKNLMMKFAKVSKYIDWIMKVTQLN